MKNKKRQGFQLSMFLLFAACVSTNSVIAQNKEKVKPKLIITSADTSTSTPLWIRMMDRENPDYAAAVKSFNDYWEDKEKPETEDELFKRVGEDEDENEEDKEREVRSAAIKYSFEYKRFLHWQLETAPYVQDDGHSILNMDQRVKAWSEQKQQIQLQKALFKKD